MNRAAKAFLALLYPEGVACYLCGEEAMLNDAGLCVSCAEVLQRQTPIRTSLRHTDGFVAAMQYTEETASAIHRFKYNDARYLAEFFVSYLELPAEWELDAIVPVPLHKRRLRKRGYNQSTLLAEALSQKTGIPVREDLIRRIRHTETQTAFNARRRAVNLRGAFAVLPAAAGQRLLLIDDVRTTGATLGACARALREAGAISVYACAACERELI